MTLSSIFAHRWRGTHPRPGHLLLLRQLLLLLVACCILNECDFAISGMDGVVEARRESVLPDLEVREVNGVRGNDGGDAEEDASVAERHGVVI